jgi:hypothetical protein
MTAIEYRFSWMAEASPVRQLRALGPIMLGAAAACGLTLAVLLLFSLGESSYAGMWFALKFGAILLACVWAVLLAGGAVLCAHRGKLALEYTLEDGRLLLTEHGRLTRTRAIPLAAVKRVRRVNGGLLLTTADMRMRVFCNPDIRTRIEHVVTQIEV